MDTVTAELYALPRRGGADIPKVLDIWCLYGSMFFYLVNIFVSEVFVEYLFHLIFDFYIKYACKKMLGKLFLGCVFLGAFTVYGTKPVWMGYCIGVLETLRCYRKGTWA